MQKDANLVELEKCCQTHVFLKKFRFDTAENEPAKNLQKFANFADPNPLGLPVLAERGDRLAAEHVGGGPLPGGQVREAWCGA